MTDTTSDSMIRYERGDDGIVILTMDDPGASANTMNEAYIAAMGAAVDRLEAERDSETGLTGVVLTSAKKTFFAGGNLRELQRRRPEDAAAFFTHVELVKSQLRRIERLGRPVVAAVNGTALGGGLEIALACHHRIAVDDPRISLGLPEVTLGLLPGGGGVTRLVRMLGLQAALTEWLLPGTQRDPAAAKTHGIIDELVTARDELIPAARAWIIAHAAEPTACVKPWDADGFTLPGGTPNTPALAAVLPSFTATLRKRLKGADLPAPKAILSCAAAGAQVDFDTALRIESRYFVQLGVGRTSTAMIQAFFLDLQTVNSGALRPSGVERRPVTRVGILGAGMMGAGIAHACATSGIEVVLRDVSIDTAEKGKAHARTLLAAQVAVGRMSPGDSDTVLDRITTTVDAADLAGVDVVIEAVFEDHRLKETVFAEVEAVVGPQTLLCSNTSTLPITGLQGSSSRPHDLIGLHFFSPVHKMKLVEIIRGEKTGDEATARAIDLVQQLRKIPIVVSDGRGFFTSRVYGTLLVEAVRLVAEGVDPATVERAATMAGFPAPPLAMQDEVSLTLSRRIRAEAAAAAQAAGHPAETNPGAELVDRMVAEFGRGGRAAGAGFYDYPADGPKQLWPGLREHFTTGTQLPLADIKDRYLFIMALETAGCLAEGVLHDTASADIGGIFGIGYPPGTGGPATFMTNYAGGLAGFVARADELADRYGERFRPSAWLRERAEAGTLV